MAATATRTARRPSKSRNGSVALTQPREACASLIRNEMSIELRVTHDGDATTITYFLRAIVFGAFGVTGWELTKQHGDESVVYHLPTQPIESCDCKDHTHNPGRTCKHMRLVNNVLAYLFPGDYSPVTE